MLERFRAAAAAFFAPLARWLNARGVSPDVITTAGTLAVVITALVCFPNGWLVPGAILVGVFCLADMLDGQMAKLSGRASRWGAFLDSSLDRVGDAAVFGGIALYFAVYRTEPFWALIAAAALMLGQLTSYVRARAESLGFSADGGLAARADRLLIILLGAALAGFGVPYVLELAVGLLAIAGAVTVVQRTISVYRQSHLDHQPSDHDQHDVGA